MRIKLGTLFYWVTRLGTKSRPGASHLKKGGRVQGPTEIRTRIVGFRVQSASHYTMGPAARLYPQKRCCQRCVVPRAPVLPRATPLSVSTWHGESLGAAQSSLRWNTHTV